MQLQEVLSDSSHVPSLHVLQSLQSLLGVQPIEEDEPKVFLALSHNGRHLVFSPVTLSSHGIHLCWSQPGLYSVLMVQHGAAPDGC